MTMRAYELRQALFHIREARGSLAAGDMPRAFRHFTLASQGLMFYCGLTQKPTSTARLRRVLVDLGEKIEAALRLPPIAPKEEILDVVVEGIRPLQREHPDIDEAELMDRARNTTMGLLGEFEIRMLPNKSQIAHRTSATEIIDEFFPKTQSNVRRAYLGPRK